MARGKIWSRPGRGRSRVGCRRCQSLGEDDFFAELLINEPDGCRQTYSGRRGLFCGPSERPRPHPASSIALRSLGRCHKQSKLLGSGTANAGSLEFATELIIADLERIKQFVDNMLTLRCLESVSRSYYFTRHRSAGIARNHALSRGDTRGSGRPPPLPLVSVRQEAASSRPMLEPLRALRRGLQSLCRGGVCGRFRSVRRRV